MLGDFPLVGLFANGEIHKSALYGFTGVLTLFVYVVGAKHTGAIKGSVTNDYGISQSRHDDRQRHPGP